MKKYTILTILILLSFVKTGLSQTNQQPQKEKQYSLSLTFQEIQTIYSGLLKLTGEQADGIKEKIKIQFNAQTQPVPPKPKTDSTKIALPKEKKN